MLTWQHNLILVRDLAEPVEALVIAPPLLHQTVSLSCGEMIPSLDRFCAAQQFPAGWVRRMLEYGATAQVITKVGEIVAAGWSVSSEFLIEEIGRRFNPGARGDYYFGDIVSGAFRGQGLQRLLIRERLLISKAQDRHSATAVTLAENHPSLANYKAEKFVVSAQLQTARKGRLRLERLQRYPISFASWALCGTRFPLPGVGRIGWS
jgi:hypothetical protein